jgi:thiol:disulfide interchange protein
MDETNTNQTPQQQAQQTTPQTTQPQSQSQTPAFDYDKLAGILAGRQAANEESVLKGYFRQQGITGEEAAQAIAAFKAEKAKNTPDPGALQSQLNAASAAALQAQMENRALLMASELGVELKTMPYLLKMADLTGAIVAGKVDEEKLKAAVNQVLEAVPQLKTTAGKEAQQTPGFRVGADTGSAGAVSDEDQLKRIFGVK